MPKSGGVPSKFTRNNNSHGLDNTFTMSRSSSKSHNSNSHSYQDFVKKVERQRCIQEFENGHEKRILNRKNNGGNEEVTNQKSKYYVGSSKYTSRPPTGVDLALGLNGYKDPTPLPKARVPSSLQNDRLEKYDVLKNYRNRTDESEMWHNFKSEVEERKAREEEERKKIVEETRFQQLEQDSILLREERTKELEKKLPKDWDYQIQLKNRVSQAHELESEKEAIAQELLAEEKRIRDEDTLADMKNKASILAQNSSAEYEERKFQDENERIEEVRREGLEASKLNSQQIFEDEEQRRDRILKTQAYQSVNKERMSQMHSTDKSKIDDDEFDYCKYKEEEQTFQRDKKTKENEKILGYRENLAAIDKRRHLESGVLADLLHGQSLNSHPQDTKRKDSSQLNDLLLNQINERKQAAVEIKLKRQEEEEARLESEALYKASELAQKERRIREQNTYREFLKMQMEEKRNLTSKREAEERDFHTLNDRAEAENEREERDRVPNLLQAH